MKDHLSPDTQSALLDDQLPAEARERALAHLASCAHCRAEYDAMQEVVELVRAAPLRPMPEGADLRLSPSMLASVEKPSQPEEGRRKQQRKRDWLSWLNLSRPGAFALGGVAAAAVVTLAVGFGLGLLSPRGSADVESMAQGAPIWTDGDAPAPAAVPQRQPAFDPADGTSSIMAEADYDDADEGEWVEGEESDYEMAEEGEAEAAWNEAMDGEAAEDGAAEADAEEAAEWEEVGEEAETRPEEAPVAQRGADSAEPSNDLRVPADSDAGDEDGGAAAPQPAALPASDPPSSALGLTGLFGLVLVLAFAGFLALRRRG